MRLLIAVVLVGLAGCSTAPVADFLDLVAPGGPGRGPGPDRIEDPLPPLPGPRDPGDPFPPAAPPRNDRDEPPPLPPVPAGYSPSRIEGDEGEPSARLRARPAPPGN